MTSSKSPNKPLKWLLPLIMVLISGQTWGFYQAYEMAGQMDSMSVKVSQSEAHADSMMMSNHHDMDQMVMGHHTMNMNDGMDCCQVSSDCQCPPNACSVINLLYFTHDIAMSLAPTSAVWTFQTNLYLNKFYAPPYRPPIA